MSGCPSVRMNVEISETIRARPLGFGVQSPELLELRKLVSACCHAHFNSRKPPKAVAPTVLMLEKKLTEMCCFYQYLSIDPTKFATSTLTATTRQKTSRNRTYERGYLGNSQR